MGNRQLDSIDWEQEFPKVPKCVHNAVEHASSMVRQKKEEKTHHISRKAILLFAASLTLFSGMTVFAASSLWQQRMEAMNEQEMQEYFENIKVSNAPAFRYNRGMTESERNLYDELNSKYEIEGVYPENALTMLSKDEEYSGKGVGYDITSGTFLLPENELSQEEILQIIDFYHKADYSLGQINEKIENGEMVLADNSISVEMDFEMMQEMTTINDKVSYLEIALEGEMLPREIAAGYGYLYLGYDNEIKRMPIGTNEVESFYQMKEDETLFALDVDKTGNLFISIRKHVTEADSYVNKLIKMDANGNIITEYKVEDAITESEKNLGNLMSYKMLEDGDGNLYVKTRWASKLLLFVFNEDGSYQNAILDETIEVHPAGEICFNEKGNLCVLADEKILKVDVTTGEVLEFLEYGTEDMVANIDTLYPMENDEFYLFSYDGFYQTDLANGTSQRILTPAENDVFEEGARCYPISEDTLVVANYKEWGITITYLTINN